ncbi:MAG: MarR family winged helix-turn-helix transcriptional regulator [Propionibacteriaceae bacterium]
MPHRALYTEQITLLRMYRALVQAELARIGKKVGLHATDVAALNHILDNHKLGNTLSPGDLGQLLSLSGPATTALLDRLENAKYIVRQQSATDGRRIEIHLTEEMDTRPGHSIFADLGNVIRGELDKRTPEEVATFTSILTDIDNAIELDLGMELQ